MFRGICFVIKEKSINAHQILNMILSFSKLIPKFEAMKF